MLIQTFITETLVILHIRGYNMKNRLPILIVGVLLISTFSAAAFTSENTEIPILEPTGRDYTHTVMVEVGTATWCPSCPASNTAWHTIYESGNYNFQYTELIDDMNPVAAQRFDEFNPRYVPTSYIDGGEYVYPGTSIPTFQNYLDQSGARTVPDITADLQAMWLGDGKIDISINIDNDETTDYGGRVRVYVIELESTMWNDYSGNPYYHAFLDFAINEEINIPAGDTHTDNTLWDGAAEGYPNISPENLQVILTIFGDEPFTGYSDPPSGNPFTGYYAEECIAKSPSITGAPFKPDPPTGPTTGFTDVEYTYTGSTTDPDGDDIYYKFDWGDGTTSGWLGPFTSGTEVEANHAWTYGDTYEVRLKAKDDVDGPWSDPLLVEIEGPSLAIADVSGGLFKANAVIENTGGQEISGVKWKINFHGGVFIGGETTGEDLTIPANGQATISTGFIFGLGSTHIRIEAWIEDGPSDIQERNGFILFFFVNIKPGGGL
jgi:hypothetical protein